MQKPYNNSDSDLKSLYALHRTRPGPATQSSYTDDLRKLAGAPGRSMAGAPGRAMAGGSGRHFAGPEDQNRNDKSAKREAQCSPAHNPVVRKLMYPTSLSIRIPDNNRIPTVDVNYNNFSTLKVGTDTAPTPYFLFLPAHNTGLAMVGGIVKYGNKTRFLPSSILPASRDLTSYTYARNMATRIGVRSGTISSTNVALAGTFNACAFYSLRDFVKFDVAEFSTRCISTCDYVQGIRSDNGVALVSGPEMIPDLRAITTDELYSEISTVFITYYNAAQLMPTKSWTNIALYDYSSDAATNIGPIFASTCITLDATATGTSVGTAAPTTAYYRYTFTYNYLKVDGTSNHRAVTLGGSMTVFLDGGDIAFSTHLIVPPVNSAEFITYIETSYWFEHTGMVKNFTIKARLPQQLDVGRLGPGFMVACIGFNPGQEIVTDVCRSIEAVPAGSLLPDRKADMSGYTTTKGKHLERAVVAFATPGINVRRVYSRLDFYALTMSAAKQNVPLASNSDLSSFSTEDRLMAGPISSIISGVSPFLSLIPGIGPMASQIGGVMGGLANSLGFAGPHTTTAVMSLVDNTTDESTSDDEVEITDDSPELDDRLREQDIADDIEMFQLAGDSLHNPESHVGFTGAAFYDVKNVDEDNIQVNMDKNDLVSNVSLPLTTVYDKIAESLSKTKTVQRYDLAMMGAPVLDDQIVVANVVGIDSKGQANVEQLYISDMPIQSYDGSGLMYDTPYREVLISDTTGAKRTLGKFFVSEDFHPDRRGQDTTDSIMTVYYALLYSGRLNTRVDQFVTLPRPGIVAGPSLGLAAAIACLGILDSDNVFSGGFIIDEGLPGITSIAGTFIKAAEVVRNAQVLICGPDEDHVEKINEAVVREDHSIGYPYVSADCLPAGIPVTAARAIVVNTILEALSIGRTLTTAKSILKETPAEFQKKQSARKADKANNDAMFNKALADGRLMIPPVLATYYNITPTPTVAEFEMLPLDKDFQNALATIEKPVARENFTKLYAATGDKLARGDIPGAFNGLKSIGDLLASVRRKANVERPAPAQIQTTGQTFARLIAGRNRKRRPAEPMEANAAPIVKVNIGRFGQGVQIPAASGSGAPAAKVARPSTMAAPAVKLGGGAEPSGSGGWSSIFSRAAKLAE